jgi:hypothetical protein
MSASASRRLAAFGVAAAILTPLALTVRSRELLGPSISAQMESLKEMGITDSKEQREMMKLIRFGVLSSGMVTQSPDHRTAATMGSPLYADTGTVCRDLIAVRGSTVIADRLKPLLDAEGDIRSIAQLISRMPAERQAAALDAAPLYLCKVP